MAGQGAISSGLAEAGKHLAKAAGKKMLSSATDRISQTTGRLGEYVSNGGGPGLMSALTGGGGGKKKDGKGKKLKVTNIVEWIDVGVPVRLAYDQWTQFTDFPSFTKKVESVEQEEDTKLKWKAQVFWSHREWEATITEQVPDKRIVWNSTGQKGSVDGAVTFHELGPELTRICLILQYHPQGFMERTGNIWRAQGRRARLEFKHFARHLMTDAILHQDEIQGWRGEIHDGEVTKDDEQARSEEEQGSEEQQAEGDEESEGRPQRSQRSQRAERGDGDRRTRRSEGGQRQQRGQRQERDNGGERGGRRDDMRLVGGGRR
jgi:uncharacterized membrane protein